MSAAAAMVAATMLASTGLSPASALPGGSRNWVAAWSAAPAGAGAGSSQAGFGNQSVRMIVRTSVAGEAVRIRLSDTFGDRHLTVGHASVALPDTSTPELSDVDPASVREVTFGGSASVVIPRGGQVLSDEVTMTVPALQDLVITLFFPAPTGPSTWHFAARAQTFVGAGDQTAVSGGTGFTVVRTSWYFLTGVDVLGRWGVGSVAVLGDSIVDGFLSTLNGNKRWTDRLAERLVSERPFGPFQVGVLNQGLAGNQVLRDGSEVGAGFPELGVNGLARLHRDGFSQSGVRVVITCLGINDIQITNENAASIIAGLKQLATQIREQGLIAIGCTITPFEGFSSWTAEKETTRLAVNDYLRTSDDFHAVLDFDAVLRDPAAPSKIKAELDSGDHIHPNDTGYAAMADSIPLRLMH